MSETTTEVPTDQAPPPPPEPPPPTGEVLRTKTEELPTKLDDTELIERARELARCASEISIEKEHSQQVKAALKERIAALEAKRGRLSSIVSSGHEPRMTLVECWARYDSNQYEEIRTDTGLVLPGSKRALAPSERQAELNLMETQPGFEDVAEANDGDQQSLVNGSTTEDGVATDDDKVTFSYPSGRWSKNPEALKANLGDKLASATEVAVTKPPVKPTKRPKKLTPIDDDGAPKDLEDRVAEARGEPPEVS